MAMACGEIVKVQEFSLGFSLSANGRQSLFHFGQQVYNTLSHLPGTLREGVNRVKEGIFIVLSPLITSALTCGWLDEFFVSTANFLSVGSFHLSCVLVEDRVYLSVGG